MKFIIIIICLGVIGFGVYKYGFQKEAPKETAQQEATAPEPDTGEKTINLSDIENDIDKLKAAFNDKKKIYYREKAEYKKLRKVYEQSYKVAPEKLDYPEKYAGQVKQLVAERDSITPQIRAKNKEISSIKEQIRNLNKKSVRKIRYWHYIGERGWHSGTAPKSGKPKRYKYEDNPAVVSQINSLDEKKAGIYKEIAQLKKRPKEIDRELSAIGKKYRNEVKDQLDPQKQKVASMKAELDKIYARIKAMGSIVEQASND